MESRTQQCIVCGDQHLESISIWGQFVCCYCENEIVKTKVDDQKYNFYVQQLRKIWLKKHA